MAKKSKRPAPAEEPPALEGGTNPLSKVDDGLDPHQKRPSEDLIYESIMRGGGEPFGTPYEAGTSSLTDKLVRFFKQRSFWRFETYEPPRAKRRRNRFTRYGASRFNGSYNLRAVKRAQRQKNTEAKKGKKT